MIAFDVPPPWSSFLAEGLFAWLVARSAFGHDARGWGLGRNGGNVPRLVPPLVRLAERLADKTQRPLRSPPSTAAATAWSPGARASTR